MKLTILASVLALATTVAHADVIKCTFTEPFIDTVYSMTQSTLTYNSFGVKPKVIKNVSFQIKSAGTFELVSKDRKVLQTLTITNNGSDGMSDRIFPFEVKDSDDMMAANSGFGGCTSNSLKSTAGQN